MRKFHSWLAGGSATFVLAAAVQIADAQQITSALRGAVVDQAGRPVTGAAITVTNTTTGSRSTATTTDGGIFNVPELLPGGPYTVRVEAPGFTPKNVEGVLLVLGETARVDIRVDQAPEQVFVVNSLAAGASATESIETHGVATTFTADNIEQQPLVSRDFKEILQQSPYAYIDPVGGGNTPPIPTLSVAGSNPRCTGFLVDGIQEKDSFGLNASGYPTNRSPLPPEWTSQVQLAVSPYDVEYNDTCGGIINIITKNGTNELHGSAYFFYKNQDLNGDKEGKLGTATTQPTKLPFLEKSYGFTLAGPLIEDHVFFFFGWDRLFNVGPISSAVGPAGSGLSRIATAITQAQVDQVVSIAKTVYGFDPLNLTSSFGEDNRRWMGKLEYQINGGNRIDLNYQYVQGGTLSVVGGNTSVTNPQVSLPSNWYISAQTMHNISISAFDTWTDNLSTEVQVGETKVHNAQNPLNGTNFPEISVRTPGANGVYDLGTASASNSNSDDGYIRFGPDASRQFNDLKYTNLFEKGLINYTLDQHAIKLGVEHHNISIFDAFVQGATSELRFDSISDFQNGIIATTLDTRTNSTDLSSTTTLGNPIYYSSGPGGNLQAAAANFAYQTSSGYIQDDWTITDALDFQIGIRDEVYTNNNFPALNPTFTTRYGFANTFNLDGLNTVMPRVAFSYHLDPQILPYQPLPSDSTITFRGGVGRYSGGFQTVWITNSYDNTGVEQLNTFGIPGKTTANGNFTTVPVQLPASILSNGQFNTQAWLNLLNTGPLSGSATSKNATVDAILPNFRIPNTWRANLGIDFGFGDGILGSGWNFTADWLNLRSYDQPRWTNLRIQPATARAPDGRYIYQWTFDPTNGRPDPAGTTAAVTGSDIALGSSQLAATGDFFIVSVQKALVTDDFGTFNFRIAATHSQINDQYPADASTANSNYIHRASVNFNEDEIGTSDYERKFRATAELTWNKAFFGEALTSMTLFFQRMSGQHYSLVYSGNPFGPSSGGVTFGSLVYVPAVDPTTHMVTATSDPKVTYSGTFDFAGFNTMLQGTGLIKYAGHIEPRNAMSGPWDSLLNFAARQELPVPMLENHKVVLSVDIFNFGNLINRHWGAYVSPNFYQTFNAISASNVVANTPYTYTGFQTMTSIASNFSVTRSASTWQIQLGAHYEF